VLAWALWALTMLGFPLVTWLDYLLRRAGRPDLALWRPETGPQVLALVSAATAGAVVEQTMQPTQASLWLRPQPPSGAAGATVARQPT